MTTLYYERGKELYHHGVKGQKWGVRRYRNKDGTLTPAGKKRYSSSSKTESTPELAKRLATGNLPSQAKQDRLSKSFEKKMQGLSKYEPKDGEWYEDSPNGRVLSKKARDYYKKYDKAYEDYSNKELELYKQRKQEEKDTRAKVFLNDQIKNDVYAARDIRQKLDSLQDETIGESSSYAKAAYQKYLKANPDSDDPEYSFYHYRWRSGNPDYDAAKKVYKEQSESLRKDYDTKTTEIGRKIFDTYADQKIEGNDYYNSYAEYGKEAADDFIRFRIREY